MAQYDDDRVCPYCGQMFFLGDCPIVATGLGGLRTLREKIDAGTLRRDQEGYISLGDRTGGGEVLFDDPGRGHTSPAPTRPVWHPDYELISRNPEAPPLAEGGVLRRILAKAPPDLSTASELVPRYLANVRGLAPTRACPYCMHPMPRSIDDREVFTVAVAGTTAASKTTLQLELVRTDGPPRHKSLFDEFALDEESPESVLNLLDGDRSTYQMTKEDTRYPPWILKVTSKFSGMPSLLFLYDLPGEVFSDRNKRAEYAGFLGWTDGLLILVDPEPFMRGSSYLQTRMVTGLLEDLSTDAHVAIVLAKADLVGMSATSLWSEQQVKDGLARLGAYGIIEAAQTAAIGPGGARVSFHAAAANPGGDGKQASYGVFEAFLAAVERTEL